MDLTKIIVGGPCKITDGGTVYYTEGDVRLEPQPVWRGIPSDVGGEHDGVLVDLTWKISFTPKSVLDYSSALIPTAYVNWATSGSRIIGPNDKTLTVAGTDGQNYVFVRAAITRMPDVYMGLGKSIWGPVEYTAFIGYNKSLVDAAAFVTGSVGNSWSQADYPTTHQESLCTAAWGAVTGFTAMYAEEGFQITHEFQTAPVKQGNVTVDERVVSYRAMCSFRPQQPTEALILAAAQFGQGSGHGIGTRQSANTHDLVITDGASNTVTLGSVAIRTGQFVFDSKLTRLGDWAMVTSATTPISSRLTIVSAA